MGRGDQIDVVTADFLEIKHDVSQIVIADFFAPAFVGYGPVLAEHASQIAVGKKDGARAILTDQGFFFAKVGMG
jgi:hypothetical protein